MKSTKTNGNGTGYVEDLQTMEHPSFTIVHHSALDTLPPTKWLIPNEIPEESLCVLYGQSGSGKSFLALDYAMTVAQHSPVLYVAAEGYKGYARRKIAWEIHHQKDGGQLHFSNDPIPLINNIDLTYVIEKIKKEVAPKFIVIDTLAWCMTGGDENSTKDMQIVISACRRIQEETGATVLIVHHTGKAGGLERGSSALRGGADVMIKLSNHDGHIKLDCDKFKDEEPFETRHLRLVTVETHQGSSCILLSSEKVVDDPNRLTNAQIKVLEVLTMTTFKNAGAMAKTISTETEYSISYIWAILSNLMDTDLVRQNKKGDPFYIKDKGTKRLEETKSKQKINSD